MFIASSGENAVLVEKICKSGFYHRECFENCEKIGGKLLNFYIIKNTATVIYTYIDENGSEYIQTMRKCKIFDPELWWQCNDAPHLKKEGDVIFWAFDGDRCAK